MSFEWRPHRGALAAMAEKRTFETFDDMALFLRDDWATLGVTLQNVQSQFYGPDTRIGWDTYIITGDLSNGEHAVLGFTNGDPSPSPAEEKTK